MPVIPYILATAGHVDHGKSALVRALTGIDTHHLPEEKSRGITMDLGFAHLVLPSPAGIDPAVTYQLGVIDVPGHEDFVKNMVAGVGSIDVALLVVAADDGWMPQTEEHLQILQYVGVSRAVVAVTKIDLAADELPAIASVRAKLRDSTFADAPVVPTSVVTGRGIDPLRAALAEVVSRTPPQRDIGKPRLPVDRAFALRGVGTVVTGTLGGGTLRRGQAVVIHPSGAAAHVRSVQTHNREVDVAVPGSRVAVNLPEIDLADAGGVPAVRRGSVVTLGTLGKPVRSAGVLLERSPRAAGGASAPLKDGAAVHLHHGSGDVPARVHLWKRPALAPGERSLAWVRFESPAFVFVGDRFIVRDWPAQHTLAGGVVLDLDADRSADAPAALRARAAAPADAGVYVATQVARDRAVPESAILVRSRFAAGEIAAAARELARTKQVVAVAGSLVDAAAWDAALRRAADAVDAWHKAHPEQVGLSLSDLRAAVEPLLPVPGIADAVTAALCDDGFLRVGPAVRRATHRPALPAHLLAAGARVRAALSRQPLEPPGRKEVAPDPTAQKALHFLLDTGEAVALGDDVVLLADHVQRAAAIVRDHLRARGQATASELKQAVGTTRRVMMPLLEYLDRTGLTARRGDVRVLRDS